MFLQDKGTLFHIEFQEDSRSQKDSPGKSRCHFSHNIYPRDIRCNSFDLKEAGTSQDHKDIELESLQGNSILVRINMKLDCQHPILQDNNSLLNNFLFQE